MQIICNIYKHYFVSIFFFNGLKFRAVKITAVKNR